MTVTKNALGCILAAVTAAVGTGAPARAGPCDIVAPTATTVTAPANGVYDVFEAGGARGEFEVAIGNTTGASAQCRIYFEMVSSPSEAMVRSGGDGLLSFTIRPRRRTLDLVLPPNTASKSPRVAVRVAPDTVRRRRFELIVPPKQFARPGTYSGKLTIGTFRGNDRTTLSQHSLTVATTVDAQGAMFVSVIGNATDASSKSALIDFRTLTENEPPVSVNILVQSNGEYRYAVTSANGGRMNLVDPPADTGVFEDFVSYTVRTDGRTLAVDGTPSPGSVFGRTSLSGRQQVFRIDVESGPRRRAGDFIEGKLSGRYQDTVTFTIVPE